jgi:hypothetical protein
VTTIVLTRLDSPKGPVNGATFTVEYNDKQAQVKILDQRAMPDPPTYDRLRAELVGLAWAIESAAQSPNGIEPAEPQQNNNISFEGRGPFEIVLRTPPTARADGATVLVVLPVPFAGAPENKVDVRLILEREHAEKLTAQLPSALKVAHVNSLKAR